MYTEIILSGTGDLSATNDSGEARALEDYSAGSGGGGRVQVKRVADVR